MRGPKDCGWQQSVAQRLRHAGWNTQCDNIPERALRLLAILLRLEEEQVSVTCRDLLKAYGCKSLNNIHPMLRRLKAAGLVTWEERRGGTLRATCYFKAEPNENNLLPV